MFGFFAARVVARNEWDIARQPTLRGRVAGSSGSDRRIGGAICGAFAPRCPSPRRAMTAWLGR
jgi:hypothetical protein